ncbi:MAG TPA: hypothetical protein VGE52_11550, partial [Pirellulales bacterium]
MPPHPVEACYCHVIEAGVQNIQRLAAVGDMAGVAVEADHVAYVARLLDDYLLYRGTRNFDEARHRAYWCEARITYQSQAS